MKVEQEIWTVEDFVTEKGRIQIAPAWQRGPAWTPPRQVLLIDSMLRGLDIPKIYLRARGQNDAFSYDAVDGQQRLRAIWLFKNNELPLIHADRLETVGDIEIHGLKYQDLPKKLRDRFDGFEINVAKIVESNQIEISILFSRLQQGVPLNPAELRNAILGPMRTTIETIALSHDFFTHSRIAEARYRRQDYVAHIFALATHGVDKDIKAPNLKHLYQEFGPADATSIMRIAKEVSDALDILCEVNGAMNMAIRHKWIVVDFAWWLIQQLRQKAKLNVASLVERFESFDSLRKQYTPAPEAVLGASGVNRKLSKHLYQYLVYFKLQAGTRAGVAARFEAIDQFLRV